MSDVVMPRLSDSMEEGTILQWLKATGDEVHRGEEIVEIETDKATMTYEADADGVLEIVAAEGDTLPIGTLIARIGGAGAPAAASSGNGAAAEVGGRTDATGGFDSPPPAPVAAPAPVPAPATQAPSPTDVPTERPKASPLARRLAREHGVELRALHGTGPG